MKKISKIYLSLSAIIITFTISYFITYKITNSKTYNYSKSVLNKNINSQNSDQKINITKDTVIVFKTLYKKSNESCIDKTIKASSEFIGKNKKQIEDLCKNNGYSIEILTDQKIIIRKTLETYSPNKYVIDMYKSGNCLAIYKTDANGRETIENEITDIKYDIKMERLKSGDIEMLKNGDPVYQFNTKNEAEGSLNENFRS